MASDASGSNNGFFLDADFIFARKEWREHLVDKLRELSGGGRARREAYRQIKPFMEAFGKLPKGEIKAGNLLLTDMFKGLKAGAIDWPLAPLLAWMSYHHQPEAASFYECSGLYEQFGQRPRPYLDVLGVQGRRTATPRQVEPVSTSFDESLSAHVDSGRPEPPKRQLPAHITKIDVLMKGHRENLISEFVGREGETSEIDSYINRRRTNEAEGFLLISGTAGIGKSTLLAKWVAGHEFQYQDRIIYFDFGAQETGFHLADMYIEYLNFELAFNLGYKPQDGIHLTQIKGALARDYNKLDGLLIIIIDGVDKAGALKYFLPTNLSLNICLIVSVRQEYLTKPETVALFLGKMYHSGLSYKHLNITGIDRDDQSLIIDNIATQLLIRRPLSPKEVEYIIDNSYFGHPIALECATRSLVTDINSPDKDAAVRRLVAGPFDGKDTRLHRILADLDRDRAVDTKSYNLFCVVCALQAPMSFGDLKRLSLICGVNSVMEISPSISRWLSITQEDDESSRLVIIGSDAIKDLVSCAMEEELRTYHRQISDALEKQSIFNSLYALFALPFHLSAAGEMRKLESVIGNSDFMDARAARFGEDLASTMFSDDLMRAVVDAVTMNTSPPDPARIVDLLVGSKD